MSDMGDDFRALRKERQEKRRSNLACGVNLLNANKINYTTPDYTHCVISHNGKVIDYWPSTGLWIDRTTKKKRRGIKQLLNYLGVQNIIQPIK